MILPTLHLKIERWKFNKEYGVYVSTLGNFKDRHKRRLPIVIRSDSYCAVKVEGTHSYKSAHRLVMLTWCPISNAEEMTVDHKNHNKRDNSLDNLEWVTREENLRRAKEDFVGGYCDGNKFIPQKQTKKRSRFSPKYSLTQYQTEIKGWLLNDKFYKNINELKEGLLEIYPNGEYSCKLQQAYHEIYTRKNLSGVRKVSNKLRLEVVFE